MFVVRVAGMGRAKLCQTSIRTALAHPQRRSYPHESVHNIAT
jgi:hypothetical protein